MNPELSAGPPQEKAAAAGGSEAHALASVGAAVRSEGPPQSSTAPSGSSEAHAAASVGAAVRSEGPPRASTAPSGGSEAHAAASVAAAVRSEGPPRASTAPSGGSEAHAVASVGAAVRSEGPPRASTAPSGGSEAHAVASVGASLPLIGFGEVRHTRLKPTVNAFNYPTYFLMLPLRSLRQSGNGALSRNRSAALSFFDRDHGEGGGDCLAWVDALLQREGITDAVGEVWLHTYPRVFGHTFKPVSFWYCHSAGGALRAVVVEVNNTFGERHCYLLDNPRYGEEVRTDKVFHVSPFCTLDGHYRFRFMRVKSEGIEKTVARIDYDDTSGPLLQTSVSGTLQVLTAATLRKALWGYPAMTFGVVARIHWQALKLWRKRVPFISKPKPPEIFVTR